QLRKPEVEKLRRDRINSSIRQLRLLLESEFQSHEPNTKLEKADILEMTVSYLKKRHMLVNVLGSYNMAVRQGRRQHTNSPTHEDGNSLDLVFSRLCSVDDFTNSPLPLSDHNLLSFSIKNCHSAQVTPTFHTYRNIQAINTQKLMMNLQSSLAPISSISCPDSALKHYNETLQSALDEAAPPIHKTTRHRRQQPWHTLQTRFLQRCSKCAERLWRKSNLPEDFIHYKFMLKTYNSALHLSKQTYFNTLITSLSNNPKRLFDTFQSLLNPREQAPTTDLRADDLANYFKEKIDHIRQEIISQSLHTMHCPPSPTASSSLSDFEAVTEEEYHLYADDTQLYTSAPDITPTFLENTSDCLTAVSNIMSSLYLKLNLSKTELLVFSPSTNLPLPDIAISVCGSTITPKQHARCLGVILDSDLSFTPYIRSLARSSYLHLKNISRIRPFLNFDSAKTLTVSLIHSRLDYCNSLLIGLPLAKLSPLQSVLNAAARIIFLTNRYTDASTLCQSLHWLPIHSRIQYKTTTLIHKALHGSAPPYISSLVSVYHPTRALRSANDLSNIKLYKKKTFQGYSQCLQETLHYLSYPRKMDQANEKVMQYFSRSYIMGSEAPGASPTNSERTLKHVIWRPWGLKNVVISHQRNLLYHEFVKYWDLEQAQASLATGSFEYIDGITMVLYMRKGLHTELYISSTAEVPNSSPQGPPTGHGFRISLVLPRSKVVTLKIHLFLGGTYQAYPNALR
ncbi:unnamed protein product, partial [Ranitomeya imitator]